MATNTVASIVYSKNKQKMMKMNSIALLALLLQVVHGFKVLNAVSRSTPSCSNTEGEIVFPYAPAGVCAPAAETAASFFDCETGKVFTFTNKTCSPESKREEEFEIKCYDGKDGNNAAGYSCSDIEASKLLQMYVGNGCGGDEAEFGGVKSLSGSQLLLVNACTQYSTDKSFKVVLGADNVVTNTNYNTGNCEGETTGTTISGPLEECFESNGRFYFVTRVHDNASGKIMGGLFTLMMVMFSSYIAMV